VTRPPGSGQNYVMNYLISSKWSLGEHFVITDDSGMPRFDVRGNLGFSRSLSLCDVSGAELATIRKLMMSTEHEIMLGGQRVANVYHKGFFGDSYEIDSGFGTLFAKGNFLGWNYTIALQGQPVATVSRLPAFGEKFAVEIAASENDVFILAVVLAIDAIHDERRRQQQGGAGGMFGAGGIFGGGIT